MFPSSFLSLIGVELSTRMPVSPRTHDARRGDTNQYALFTSFASLLLHETYNSSRLFLRSQSYRPPAHFRTAPPPDHPQNPIKRTIVHIWKRTSRAARRERESQLLPGFELVATPPPTPPKSSRARNTITRSSSRLRKCPQRQRSDSWVIV